jgi:predicted AAA+ superfamily ATPase
MAKSSFISRKMGVKLRKLAKKFPVVALLGPRQSGKTTLIKKIFPNHPCVSLEDLDRRQFAEEDPRGFLATFCLENRIFIDEVQRVPALFSYIQTQVDEHPIPGSFILSGSHNFLLNQHISQTLAGRVALLTLLPLTYQELKQGHKEDLNLEEILFQGFYPRVCAEKIAPTDWYPNYIRTFIERDVRMVTSVGDLNTFHKFLKLCAGRSGQLLNLTSLGNECGITHNTVKAWISILEASYVLFLLQPYHRNYNKRLVKTPKLYFYDTGVACSLLDIETAKQVATHYAKGALFESFVISELMKERLNSGLLPNASFWRDSHGHEVDCILENGDKITAIEIKSSQTPSGSFFDELNYWNQLTGTLPENNFVIYGGKQLQKRQQGVFLGWNRLAKVF